MPVEMVFNELSLKAPAIDKRTARDWMENFIETVRIATIQGVQRKLIARADFDQLLLSTNYKIVQWRNDPDVDKDLRSFFRNLQDKSDPPLPDIVNPAFEVFYEAMPAFGLGYACIHSSLAVSVKSDPSWDQSSLDIEVKKLNEDAEVVDECVSILHASSGEHIYEHSDWIQRQLQNFLTSGKEVWNHRNDLFTNLEFCGAVEKQLEGLYAGDPLLKSVTERLFELDNFCRQWEERIFNPKTLPCKASPESEATRNKFRSERTFMCPDGERRYFEWHVRLTPHAWRIHFIPVPPTDHNLSGKMTIGYIGTHLPTAKSN
jgi:hypothetical protein